MIFDSHAHYDDEQFDTDREAVLSSLKEQGVGTIINVSESLDSCQRAVALAKTHEQIYGAVGVHPDKVGDLNEATFQEMETLLSCDKVKAVGEIGLDYYWDKEPREVQETWFIRQLELAGKHHLPVLIHSRDAAADTMRIMKAHAKGIGGVIHCYSYSLEHAREYVDMGFYIGVGGVVTFKNSKKLKEVVREIPLERILLETDCPYLAPAPHRGERNNSGYLTYVIQQIAEIKGISETEVEAVTEKNGKEMFRI